MPVQPLEDPFYYLANFQRVLTWLGARYADVLDADEHAFIARFAEVPRPAQALCVRMVMRRGTLFRASQLSYPEIGPCTRAAQPLLQAGWLLHNPAVDLAQLFGLLGKPELRAAFAGHGLAASQRKDQWLEHLAGHYPEPRAFADWCPALGDSLFEVRIQHLCDRFRLMFFGNLRQDWSQFVLADLGLQRFEVVTLEASSRGLRTRADLLAATALHECREALEAGMPAAELHGRLQALPVLDNPWLAGRRDRVVFAIGQACERAGQFDQAVQVYADCAWPGARYRRIRALERGLRFEEALALADIAQLAPENAAEAQALPRILPRLHRQLGRAPLPRKARPPVERVDLCLEPGAERVEFLAQAHFDRQEAPVLYVENSLLNSLFGLLCWPAIFAPLPGAFFHPFQSGPADLLQADFGQRREGLFNACLAELEAGSYRQTILARFETKYGLASPFVYWEALNEGLLGLALHCIPAQHLWLCFERLLQDVKANRAGMPDLIQFWPQRAQYRMIEVKGPGDRLQDNQLRWIEFCAQHGLPVAVCHVTWAQTTE